MALEKCPKCGRMHYATDPCRPTLVNVKTITRDEALKIWPMPTQNEVADAYGIPRPKPTKDRHRPGYYTEYMRGYRARKKAEK